MLLKVYVCVEEQRGGKGPWTKTLYTDHSWTYVHIRTAGNDLVNWTDITREKENHYKG